VEPFATVRFSTAARLLAAEARRRGLSPPGFRSPPREAGVVRAIRRYPGGQAVVAVRVRGRPHAEVVADMVDGLLVANGLGAAGASGLRAQLLAAATDQEAEEGGTRAA
jgi:hypothetical protein